MSSYYGQNGNLTHIFKGSSRWTLVATGAVTVVCAALLLFYQLTLRDVQQKHDREYGERRAGSRGEGTGHENEKPSKMHSSPKSYGLFFFPTVYI